MELTENEVKSLVPKLGTAKKVLPLQASMVYSPLCSYSIIHYCIVHEKDGHPDVLCMDIIDTGMLVASINIGHHINSCVRLPIFLCN